MTLSVTFGDSSPKGAAATTAASGGNREKLLGQPLGAATRVRSTPIGRPGSFVLPAEGILWRRRAGLAYEVSDFWIKHLAERLLASIAGRCSF